MRIHVSGHEAPRRRSASLAVSLYLLRRKPQRLVVSMAGERCVGGWERGCGAVLAAREDKEKRVVERTRDLMVVGMLRCVGVDCS